ncbi:hypothetical protein N7491_008017 [Penicillium cf. griseofulvum]|uniref:Uncharacterized protein n=1 Tax=Penicillium cf. griseofulvum TaxID=2972120 RepID=A0A9W9J5C7_9EURO|nr:hypothetical protein N7472_008956 [Penicillium cf. griseofulvum]KAJ5427575.1 hypothetical protein N7491_008017 [Penicillium cf. griseofulvum]KAJ5431772.1 hypothetical protein N7445_008270 [Penicillium cf. griseofulvum]
MPPLNDSQQHQHMLATLERRIRDLRSNPETRLLIIARLNAISCLARICAQFGKDIRFTQLCDALHSGLPRQIALLKSDINSNIIVADALERIILESSFVRRSVAVVDSDDEKADGEANQGVDTYASDEESDMDSSDDNYIARLLLGSKWAKPIVDFDEEPYGEIVVSPASVSEEESEIDSSDDNYVARLLLGPSWATPLADFAEVSYGRKKGAGR